MSAIGVVGGWVPVVRACMFFLVVHGVMVGKFALVLE